MGVSATAAAASQAGVAWAAPATGFDDLRTRWADSLTGGDFDASDPVYAAALQKVDATAAADRAKLDRSSGRTQVFTDVPFTTSAEVTSTYSRLRDMAIAYATNGAALHGDAGLADDIVAGLELTNQRIYNATRKEFGNWWDWEIGSPQRLNDTCVLVYDKLSAEQLARYAAAVDHFVPTPTRMINGATLSTGANRTDLCQVVTIRGILGQDAAKIASGRDALSPVFAYVTTGDGFYRDGSFVQHTYVPYTGTYGLVLLSGLGKLVALLAGSTWAITDPNIKIIFDAVDLTYAPVVHDDIMTDFVRGRAVSRQSETDHSDGHAAVEDILRLAQGAPAASAARWRAQCKGWVTRDHYDDYFAGASVPRIALVKPIVDDASIAAAPEKVGCTQFPNMDRVIHRAKGWAYAIAMASHRISYYECGNNENLHGFHTGDGMTYLYDQDQGQFTDDFWPTVDPYRLPGITVDTRPLPDGAGGQWRNPRPSTTWVGGATANGYGAVGMDLQPLDTTLRGRKSWFLLDDRVVALGAGITATGGRDIETVVESRNLHADGTNRLTIDGAAQPTGTGKEATFSRARWAHLDQVGGYVLLDRPTLHALREDRTGAWTDINKLAGFADSAPVTRRYQTLWLDHGTDPAGATYAYLLLPGANAGTTAKVADDPGLRVLANNADAQAVQVPHLGLTMINFWSAGTVGGVTVSAPASVLVQEDRGSMTVAVSDPTHLHDPIRVQIARPNYQQVEHADDTVVVEGLRGSISLVVDVQGTHGATHTVRLGHGRPSGHEQKVLLPQPSADAYVRDGSYANDNYGSVTGLVVKNAPGTGFDRRSYLRFDQLPDSSTIAKATLWVSAYTADSGGTTTQIAAHAVSGSWSEDTLTWNNQPTIGTHLGDATVTNVDDWVGFEITGYVTAASGSVDVALTEDAEGLAVIVRSRESDRPPFLEIVTAG